MELFLNKKVAKRWIGWKRALRDPQILLCVTFPMSKRDVKGHVYVPRLLTNIGDLNKHQTTSIINSVDRYVLINVSEEFSYRF